ncbi:uncharacterized protein SAPINGB_P001462 [Magnusiomyces paraingens]|uniref:Uncharacterized protein n=1 Tax=Magnusiomyces paraingens TaxID=2606893 RepID=A0A5E8BBZ8_9ASCO|nr:uncharacterized protein SAPINGB_P001462 [Saprochaete ingens]VVT46938.1 unnamed protein product [Saprochaete ingens]
MTNPLSGFSKSTTSPPSFGSEQLHHDLFQSKLKLHQLQKFKQQLDTRRKNPLANPSELEAEERAYAQEFERIRCEIVEASALADKNFEQARAARQEQKKKQKRQLNRTRSASLGNIPDEMLTDSSFFDTTNAQSLSEIEREFHETEKRLYNSNNNNNNGNNNGNNRPVIPPSRFRNENQSPSPISRNSYSHDPILSRPSSAPIPVQQQHHHHSHDNEEIMSLNYQLQEMQILLQQRNNHIESLNRENQRLNEVIAKQQQQQQLQQQQQQQKLHKQELHQELQQEQQQQPQINNRPLDDDEDRDPEDDYAILKNLITHLTRISGTLGARYKLPVSITRAIDYAVEGLEQLSQGRQIDKAYVRRLRSITRSSNVYYDKADNNNFEDSQDSEERLRVAETVASEAAAELARQQQAVAQRTAQLVEMRRALADYYLTVLVQSSRIIDYDCVAAYLRAELAGYRARAHRQAEVLSAALAGTRAGELINRKMMMMNKTTTTTTTTTTTMTKKQGTNGCGAGSRAMVMGYESRKEKIVRMRAKFLALAYMVLAAVRMRERARTARAVRHEVQRWALSDIPIGSNDGTTLVGPTSETRMAQTQMPVVSREAARLQAESRRREPVPTKNNGGLLRPTVQSVNGFSQNRHVVARGGTSSSTVSTEKDRILRYY